MIVYFGHFCLVLPYKPVFCLSISFFQLCASTPPTVSDRINPCAYPSNPRHCTIICAHHFFTDIGAKLSPLFFLLQVLPKEDDLLLWQCMRLLIHMTLCAVGAYVHSVCISSTSALIGPPPNTQQTRKLMHSLPSCLHLTLKR